MAPLCDIIAHRQKQIARRIRAICRRRYTQREIAKRAGISDVHLCNVLSGKSPASVELLDTLLLISHNCNS